jgi:hypothetical protein
MSAGTRSRTADLRALAGADEDEKDGSHDAEDDEEDVYDYPAAPVVRAVTSAATTPTADKADDDLLVCTAEGCTGKDLRRSEDYSAGQLLKKKPKCRECMRKKATARRSVTYECKQQLLKQQDGRCGICKLKFKNTKARVGYAVDHEHLVSGDNGKLRGLLCPLHNLAISYCKDSTVLFIRSILYLEANREVAPECSTQTQSIRRLLEEALALAEWRDVQIMPKEQREALYDSPFKVKTADRMLAVVPSEVAVTAASTSGKVSVVEGDDDDKIILLEPHVTKRSSVVVHIFCVVLAAMIIVWRIL